MLHFLNVQQRTAFAQHFDDDVVGFKDVNTVQRRIGPRQVGTVRADRVGNFQAVFLADGVVVRTVAAGGMDRTGTRIQSDVIAEDGRYVEVEERMLKAHQFQFITFHRRQDGVIRNTRAFHHAFNQIFRQDQRLVCDLHQRIVEFRRQGDGAVGWQGPRGGGPDDQ